MKLYLLAAAALAVSTASVSAAVSLVRELYSKLLRPLASSCSLWSFFDAESHHDLFLFLAGSRQ